jgi:hypothetical protein
MGTTMNGLKVKKLLEKTDLYERRDPTGQTLYYSI